MRNRTHFEAFLLLLLSGLLLYRTLQIGEQWLLRWRFAGLILFSSLIIAGLAFYHWKHPDLIFKLRSNPLPYCLWVAGILISVGAGLLPVREVIYITPGQEEKAPLPPAVKLKIQPDQIVNIPQSDKNLLDWVKLFSSTDPHQYQGSKIDVTGFVDYGSGLAAGQFMIHRLTLTCCVADPIPVGLIVNWHPDEHPAAGSWVRVQGSVVISDVDGEVLPEIEAQTVEPILQPDQPYLFTK